MRISITEAMAADPETRRWWKETDPCQSPLPDAAAARKIWADSKDGLFPDVNPKDRPE